MNKNSQIHFYIETGVLEELKKIAAEKGITVSKLCREKLRDFSILARLQATLDNINNKVAKEEKILDLLRSSIKGKLC
jgi:rRNA-processing protein FCF1